MSKISIELLLDELGDCPEGTLVLVPQPGLVESARRGTCKPDGSDFQESKGYDFYVPAGRVPALVLVTHE